MSWIIKTTRVFDTLVKNHNARTQILQGGTSSSKTFSILQYLIFLALRSKSSLTISVVSETLPHLRKGAEKDFFKIVGDSYDVRLHNKTEHTYKIGNSVIEFFSADQPGKVRGPRRDILFINEANNIPKETYEQLSIRTRLKIFLDFNPVAEFWAHELVKQPDTVYTISTYLDNQYLDANIIKAIEQRRYNDDGTETDWWQVYGAGQIGRNQGCIYTHWSQVESLPEDADKRTYGLDFGYTNDPTALVKVVVSSGALWLDEIIYEYGLTNQEISARMYGCALTPRTTPIYADSAEPKSIAELRHLGWAVKPTHKGKDSINIGIDLIKSMPLYVTKDSINIIKELRNYKWMTDRNGKSLNVPIDDWNDCLDALRYALTYRVLRHEVVGKRMRY